MQNAWPSGHILAKGNFGPLLPSNLGATQVSGDFTFTSVKLEDIHGLSGGLSSAGRFYGALTSNRSRRDIGHAGLRRRQGQTDAAGHFDPRHYQWSEREYHSSHSRRPCRCERRSCRGRYCRVAKGHEPRNKRRQRPRTRYSAPFFQGRSPHYRRCVAGIAMPVSHRLGRD
jgi:hypothetical protein